MALVLVSLLASHGLQYVLAATILTGLIQFILGIFGVANLMRFIPNSVMLGFVNALGIMIFMTQMPYLIGGSVMTYVFAIVTLLLVYLIPRYVRLVRSEEHTSELQSRGHLVCRLLLEKKNIVSILLT